MSGAASRHSMPAREPLATPIPMHSFKAEVRLWAKRLELDPTEIHLVGMKHKWASCSSRGRVSFALELLGQPEEFRREVIVHELLHLKVRNHGALFGALLRAHLATGSGSAQPG